MRSPATRSVPFKITEIHGGISEAHGSAYVDDEALVLELQTTVLSMFKQAPKQFRIELTDLESVEHKRGLFGDKVTLRTRPFDLIAGIPGVAEGKLCLRMKRKDRALLAPVLDRLDLWLA